MTQNGTRRREMSGVFQPILIDLLILHLFRVDFLDIMFQNRWGHVAQAKTLAISCDTRCLEFASQPNIFVKKIPSIVFFSNFNSIISPNP